MNLIPSSSPEDPVSKEPSSPSLHESGSSTDSLLWPDIALCPHLFERFYGSFHRSLALPATVDQRNVKADFKDGVLKVHLSKSIQTNGKKIEFN